MNPPEKMDATDTERKALSAYQRYMQATDSSRWAQKRPREKWLGPGGFKDRQELGAVRAIMKALGI